MIGNDTKSTATDPVYEGETWVHAGCSMRIVCKIPIREPFALQWTRNNQPLNLSSVRKSLNSTSSALH